MRRMDKNTRAERRGHKKEQRKNLLRDDLDWLHHDMGWVFLVLGCVLGKILSSISKAFGW